MAFLSSIIFLVIGLLIGFIFVKKQWEPIWYDNDYKDGVEDYVTEHVVIIKDTLPEKPTKKNLVLKLQNELMNYVTVTDDSVEIQVIKKTSEVSEANESKEN